jgi:hypothetical protein
VVFGQYHVIHIFAIPLLIAHWRQRAPGSLPFFVRGLRHPAARIIADFSRFLTSALSTILLNKRIIVFKFPHRKGNRYCLYSLSFSMPMKFRFNFFAATPVVPIPNPEIECVFLNNNGRRQPLIRSNYEGEAEWTAGANPEGLT